MRPSNTGWRLSGLCRPPTLHHLDIADADALEQCLRSVAPTQIIHLATNTAGSARHGAGRTAKSDEQDVAQLAALLRIAAALPEPPRAFIRSGSIAEYGPTADPAHEDMPPRPTTAYGCAMLACTTYAQRIAPDLPFPVRTARLGQAYGLHQPTSFLIPALINACLMGDPFHVSRPDDTRDLTHIDDIVSGLCALLDAPEGTPDIINLSRGDGISIRRVADIIVDATECPADLIGFGPLHSPSLQCASPSLAEIHLGWTPRIDAVHGLAALVRQTITATMPSRAPCATLAS